jgi:membrane protein YqaA with SNARE-associated domain
MKTFQDFTRVQILGSVLLLIGFIIRLFIGKRRFDRRGVGGMQHYQSYWVALIIIFFEWLVSIASLLMILSGLLLLLVEYYNGSWIA